MTLTSTGEASYLSEILCLRGRWRRLLELRQLREQRLLVPFMFLLDPNPNHNSNPNPSAAQSSPAAPLVSLETRHSVPSGLHQPRPHGRSVLAWQLHPLDPSSGCLGE